MSFVTGLDTMPASPRSMSNTILRTEGIFTEPAGGTEVAVTKKLIEQGRIPRDTR